MSREIINKLFSYFYRGGLRKNPAFPNPLTPQSISDFARFTEIWEI